MCVNIFADSVTVWQPDADSNADANTDCVSDTIKVSQSDTHCQSDTNSDCQPDAERYRESDPKQQPNAISDSEPISVFDCIAVPVVEPDCDLKPNADV